MNFSFSSAYSKIGKKLILIGILSICSSAGAFSSVFDIKLRGLTSGNDPLNLFGLHVFTEPDQYRNLEFVNIAYEFRARFNLGDNFRILNGGGFGIGRGENDPFIFPLISATVVMNSSSYEFKFFDTRPFSNEAASFEVGASTAVGVGFAGGAHSGFGRPLTNRFGFYGNLPESIAISASPSRPLIYNSLFEFGSFAFGVCINQVCTNTAGGPTGALGRINYFEMTPVQMGSGIPEPSSWIMFLIGFWAVARAATRCASARTA